MARKRSFFGRLLRGIVWLVLRCAWPSSILAVAAAALDQSRPSRAFMAEAQVAAWASRDSNYVLRHSWVDLDRISPNLPLAVVASEDQKFPEHWGFDVEAIEKAYALNQHSHKVRGASTISQQVAKNLFLWSGRSYFRKGLEAYFTVLIESLLAEAAHPGDLFEHRRVRLWHLRRRGRRAALLPQAGGAADAQRCRGARGGIAESGALVGGRAVRLRAAAARMDPRTDAGAGRPGNAGRNRRLPEPAP